MLIVGFVLVASILFAALTVSSLELWAFPIMVSLWTAFLWVLIGKGVRTFSTPPHQPGRVAAIIIGCSVVAIVTLGASILIGLLMLGPHVAGR